MLLSTVSLLMGLDIVWYGRTTCILETEEKEGTLNRRTSELNQLQDMSWQDETKEKNQN